MRGHSLWEFEDGHYAAADHVEEFLQADFLEHHQRGGDPGPDGCFPAVIV